MSFARGLACKECGAAYPAGPHMMCEQCFGPLEVRYDYDAMRRAVSRETIEAGPRSVWRYRDLLPVEGPPATGLRTGFTPLVRAERLAQALGVRELYLKDDSANLPDLQLQGPRGGGGGDPRQGARLRHGRLRLDGQPGAQRRGPRGTPRGCGRW